MKSSVGLAHLFASYTVLVAPAAADVPDQEQRYVIKNVRGFASIQDGLTTYFNTDCDREPRGSSLADRRPVGESEEQSKRTRRMSSQTALRLQTAK